MKNFVMAAAFASLSAVAAYATPACASGADATVPPVPGDSFSLAGSCTVGSYVFSNFNVFLAVGPFPVGGFGVSIFVDPAFGIDINYTGITAPADFHISFQATPGIGAIELMTGVGSTVSEGICNAAFNVNNGSSPCGGSLLNTTVLTAANGGTVSSIVTGSGTDYFYKDISGGSEVTQLILPEPMTFSLMGAGLLGLGVLARRRRK